MGNSKIFTSGQEEKPVEIKLQDLDFTIDKIENIYEQSNKIAVIDALLSESYRTARDRYDNVEHDHEVDGKKVKVTEKECWDDFYQNDEEATTYYILKDKYKHIFDYKKTATKLKADMAQYMIMNFGKDYSQIQFADHIRINHGIYHIATRDIMQVVEKLQIDQKNLKDQIDVMNKKIKKQEKTIKDLSGKIT